MATDRPPPPALSSIMLCEKRESLVNSQLVASCKVWVFNPVVVFELFLSKYLSGVPVNPGGGGEELL